jgi:hypothetical protein
VALAGEGEQHHVFGGGSLRHHCIAACQPAAHCSTISLVVVEYVW